MKVELEALQRYRDKKKEREALLVKAKELQKLRNYGAIKEPVGLFKKRCPYCGSPLAKTFYLRVNTSGYDAFLMGSHRRCTNECCEYEWGSWDGRDLDIRHLTWVE